MMKDFFKKLNRNQAEPEDLDTGYDSEYYQGAYSNDTRRTDDRRIDDRRVDDRRVDDRRVDDRRIDDRRVDDRRIDDRRIDDRRVDDRRIDDRRVDDLPLPQTAPITSSASIADGYYEEPTYARPAAPVVPAMRGWQEADAPAYRERVEPAEKPERTEAVFTPAPAPEYLYFTPSTYRDCREAIVRGLSAGHVVVVRLGKLATEDILRLFDYMMGAVLALNGELVRPRSSTVVLLPDGVELDEEALDPDDDESDDEDEYDDELDDDESDDEDEDEDDEENGEYDDEYHDGEYGSYDDSDEYEEYDDENDTDTEEEE